MTAALVALRSAAAELLIAQGDHQLGAVLAHAELENVGPDEFWSMGTRTVTACRLSLLLDASTFAWVTADTTRVEQLRDAFTKVVRSPDTELADLSIVLRLPTVQRPWRHVYRDAPPTLTSERAEPAAILGGAAALLEARGDAFGAAMLQRAKLDSARIAGSGPPALVRVVVRLDPADLVVAERDGRAERLRQAVHDAARRADEVVATVDLATAVRAASAQDDAEARFAAALAARGAVVVPIVRTGDDVDLAVIYGGELHVVTINSQGQRVSGWQRHTIASMTISRQQLNNAEQVHEIAALLCGDSKL